MKSNLTTNIIKPIPPSIPVTVTGASQTTPITYISGRKSYSIWVFTNSTVSTVKSINPSKNIKIGYCVIGGGGGGYNNTTNYFGGSGGGVNISSVANSETTLTASNTYTITVGLGLQINHGSITTTGGTSTISGSNITTISGLQGLNNSSASNSLVNSFRTPESITTPVIGTTATTVSGVGGRGDSTSWRNGSAGASGVILNNYITEVSLYGTVAGGGGGSENKLNGPGWGGGAGGGGSGAGASSLGNKTSGGACSVKYGGITGTYLFGSAGSDVSNTNATTGGNGGTGGANSGGGGGGYNDIPSSSHSSTGGTGCVVIFYENY